MGWGNFDCRVDWQNSCAAMFSAVVSSLVGFL